MLEIDPSQQLAFRGPLTRHVEVQLALSNPSSDLVAYKIKTTAPKQYCVKPNSGRIAPNSSVSIQVILQPLKEEPASDFKCKDKFLIQSVVLTPETAKISLADLWTSLENGPKDKIQQKKIRCVFLSEHEEQEQHAEPSKLEGGETNEEFANASAIRPNSYEELNKTQDPSVLRKELSDARETIQRMQRTIDSYGKDGQPGNPALAAKSMAMIPANSEGYPAYVVFLVSLLVALLTWYFT